jgi:hypothetical protein
VSIQAAIGGHTISRLLTVTEAQVQGLAELLIDCVDGGASVSFMHPLSRSKALDFWCRVAHGVTQGERALLVLDTASGAAERLYAALGWQRCGVIPDYALLPHGGFCDTTFFYRRLDTEAA